MARAHALAWATLDELLVAVRAFVDPILAGGGGRWDEAAWRWRDEA